jgi:hypothetical protein
MAGAAEGEITESRVEAPSLGAWNPILIESHVAATEIDAESTRSERGGLTRLRAFEDRPRMQSRPAPELERLISARRRERAHRRGSRWRGTNDYRGILSSGESPSRRRSSRTPCPPAIQTPPAFESSSSLKKSTESGESGGHVRVSALPCDRRARVKAWPDGDSGRWSVRSCARHSTSPPLRSLPHPRIRLHPRP